MKEDAGIQWIRDIRSRISRELHNNPKEFVAFHQSLRAKYQRESESVWVPDQDSAALHPGR